MNQRSNAPLYVFAALTGFLLWLSLQPAAPIPDVPPEPPIPAPAPEPAPKPPRPGPGPQP